MKIETGATTKTAHERYKKGFDQSVWVEKKYRQSDYFYLGVFYRHKLEADKLAQAMSKEIQPRERKHFRVISVYSHTPTLYDDRIDKTGSADRMSLARRKEGLAKQHRYVVMEETAIHWRERHHQKTLKTINVGKSTTSLTKFLGMVECLPIGGIPFDGVCPHLMATPWSQHNS